MKISRKVLAESIIDDVYCNLCGLSCKSPMGENYGLVEAEVTGGLESTHLEDGSVHKFSLCERCLADMIQAFRYPSLQGNFLFPNPENDAPDFNPHKYFNKGTIILDEMDPESIIKALDLDGQVSYDDDQFPQYADSAEELDEGDQELVTYTGPKPKKEDMN